MLQCSLQGNAILNYCNVNSDLRNTNNKNHSWNVKEGHNMCISNFKLILIEKII